MTSTYDRAVPLVLLMLKGERNPTPETIRKKVDLVLAMLQAEGNTDSVNRERLTREVESRCEIWRGTATVLEDRKNHTIWLPYRKSQIDWKFWRRYERYLMEERRFSEQSIITLDELTDRVLERLEDPHQEGSWDRRGMVVGQVQSGKTANYTGLICKAADAGYKLIIVLAGMHKSLRSQTQLRLDEGFLGFDTQLNRAFNHENLRIGVGNLQGEEFITVHSLTSSADTGDFNRRVASQVGVLPGGNDPVLLVVKKNKSVLTNLINWATSVRGQEDPHTGVRIVRGIPLLVIDDEADNASVNTNPIPRDENGTLLDDYEVSAINGKIRTLLSHFEKSAYIGYTATPFANIFIYPQGETVTHGEDLFPRDFIINLPAPPNYIGPSQIFGFPWDGADGEDRSGLPIIRTINDYHRFIPDDHKTDHNPQELPGSLKKAIRSFILSCAARMARGEQKNHSSMLIHVTRYTAVQEKVHRLVNDELNLIRRRLEYSDLTSPDGIYREIEDIWNSDYVDTTHSVLQQIDDPLITELTWNDIQHRLFDAATRIRVKLINGTASDALDYAEHPDGLSVIAIGGDKLSRGLTLEGLSVSYYLRASRMYDTLMQMGRWFGFRPGYIDLCRLYTSRELVEWYQHISLASEELQSEFDYMATLNATPSDYGLRVRTHPDGLLITAVNKMRHGTVMDVSYANSLIETVFFHKDPNILLNNLNVVDQFIKNLGPSSRFSGQNHLWDNIRTPIVQELLNEYIIHEDSRKANPGPLIEYIEKRFSQGELTHWTVALINNTQAARRFTLGGHDIGLTRRADPDPSSPKYALKKGHIIDPKHEFIDLSSDQIEEALRMMLTDPDRSSRSEKIPTVPSGPYIRRVRSPKQGLLLIYPLDPEPPQVSIPVMGLALSIPDSRKTVKVQYKVNNIYWEQEFDS
ncbi:Z1 domain-containing protein [Methanoculleus bourgensis]|uniref:Z1 domain-containing protein n=1 Tax=Methanoculleus bourgensis TaxID=83986 RepID=UPI0022EE30A1|nr:Z1 domain-containing protein [Methanoculleus bourgensis]GLI45744.1 endonuclease [Methanoculleus bourgensis]